MVSEKQSIVNIVGATAGAVAVSAGSSSSGSVTGSASTRPADPPALGAANASKGSQGVQGRGDAPIDFAILTAIEVERRAVCTAFGLGDDHRVKIGSRVYWRGRLPLSTGEHYEVVVAQSPDMANVDAALLTSDLLHHWQPQAALMVGIAASTKPEEVKLGDVVAGSEVFYYERGKVTPQGTKPEPKMVPADATLSTNVTALPDWKAELPVMRPDDTEDHPRLHFGVIASGEKVLADEAMRDQIAAGHRKILAIEMEGYGFSRAVWQSFDGVRHMVIRGICDDGTPAKGDKWHAYAAASATGFAKHFLLDRPLAPKSTRHRIQRYVVGGVAGVTVLTIAFLAIALWRIGNRDRVPDSGVADNSAAYARSKQDHALPVAVPTEDAQQHLSDSCRTPWVILDTTYKHHGPSYPWNIARQTFLVYWPLTIVEGEPGVQEIHLAPYEIDGAFALAATCFDAATCNKLADIYKATVGSPVQLSCGKPKILGELPVAKFAWSQNLQENLPAANDKQALCARLNACELASLRGVQRLFVECQHDPTKFKTHCARRYRCDKVLACLLADEPPPKIP